jgi:phenylalanyl-tRNA synthetase alpha chain
MVEPIEAMREAALQALDEVRTIEGLAAWRVTHMGRHSPLMDFLGDLGTLPASERPAAGRAANQAKQALEAALSVKEQAVRLEQLKQALASEKLDLTLPGRPPQRGRLHPSTQVLRHILAIWAEMGFQVYRSREVESDEYNFQLLNFPPHHPARDMQDTFYTARPGVILRTHTSPGQVRVMRERCPEPIRVVLPGMCFRFEQVTARAEAQFYQVEGLAVGVGISLANLKATLADFARRMFGASVRVRFRADYFPFTEPSAEMDIECFICGGSGCPVCKRSGWLEILGAGMVHPIVLQNGGYDPRRYSGFAFGMGPERIAMLRHGIADIRAFWANDPRFLEQF